MRLAAGYQLRCDGGGTGSSDVRKAKAGIKSDLSSLLARAQVSMVAEERSWTRTFLSREATLPPTHGGSAGQHTYLHSRPRRGTIYKTPANDREVGYNSSRAATLANGWSASKLAHPVPPNPYTTHNPPHPSAVSVIMRAPPRLFAS
ncbi:hypothetical protein CMUS01_04325 [Colletotrichum musicola]|uniref:Uncharacterized protein n=1 Tax=Colletotrichum musicola TaxID=2175873 RepID=A0A8H6KXB8_9PEZI|nr:hypothetical protein CMUS01_04325 [Colletotrichum musicola]